MIAGMGLVQFIVVALIVLGVVAIFWVVVTRALGFTPPPWAVTCFWIVVAVVVGIFLIKLLVSLAA